MTQLSSHAAQVPKVAADYFGARGGWNEDHPTVSQIFKPETGWKRPGYNKRVSGSWARKVSKEGVTDVQLEHAASGRRADFRIEELFHDRRKGKQ